MQVQQNYNTVYNYTQEEIDKENAFKAERKVKVDECANARLITQTQNEEKATKTKTDKQAKDSENLANIKENTRLTASVFAGSAFVVLLLHIVSFGPLNNFINK